MEIWEEKKCSAYLFHLIFAKYGKNQRMGKWLVPSQAVIWNQIQDKNVGLLIHISRITEDKIRFNAYHHTCISSPSLRYFVTGSLYTVLASKPGPEP